MRKKKGIHLHTHGMLTVKIFAVQTELTTIPFRIGCTPYRACTVFIFYLCLRTKINSN